MSIYTKTGDKGKTLLQNGAPVPKHHPVVQAMAALDELNAHLGIVKSQSSPTQDMEKIQKNIMKVLSLVSTAEKSPAPAITNNANWDDIFNEETKDLEAEIDAINSILPPITSFVTYGANPLSATLDLARAVARRAETNLSQAAETSGYAKAALAYLNRLADFLYMKARYADFEQTVIQAVKDALPPTPGHAGRLYSAPAVSHTCEPVGTNKLTLTQAKTLLEKIEHKAKEMNLPIAAACVNAAGSPIAVHAMDSALLVSYEAALAKAYTSAALKMPTADLSKLVQPGQQFYGLEAVGGGKILPIGGGIPLYNGEGRLIGAIGVSGGTAQQDHELASLVL
ncbi:MAG: cob(I)yrinic acid a,c-diamide adenosyltransferase [Defluviitaleaceae bacterium]|nr:cob(I)yrinic acid a,c-diamide adenosyltransferase [Defluviitaleaceae bacterium]